jgi:hypothetical protein
VDAALVDVNNDGHTDLVIASGGNEYYGQDEHLLPRVYLNDGKAGFKKHNDAFRDVFVTASCVKPFDFNKDGFVDLFIGGRAVPWEFGKTPKSFLLQNDGTGRFTDVTAKLAPDLVTVGLVTQAVWTDLDNDRDEDLVVTCEWGGILAFVNSNGKFSKRELAGNRGWWNFILPVDLDNDNDIDFIAGNLGLNSRLKASTREPVKLYYNDFDDNGKKEQVLAYHINGKEIAFVNKDELQKQLPFIKKEFLYAGDFAKATIGEIFGSDKLKNAEVLSADYFSSAVLINNGNLDFTLAALPWEVQISSYRDAIVIDANGDPFPDILMVGNFYPNNIQMGRYDADYGTILVNRGNGRFECAGIDGVQVKGEVRRVKALSLGGQPAFVLARNNDSVMVIRQTPGKLSGGALR